MMTSKIPVKWLTVMCVIGIAAGVAVGMLMSHFAPSMTGGPVLIADSVVRAWTNAFRALVLPLVMAQLYLAVAGKREGAVSAGRIGMLTTVTFIALLAFSALVAALIVPMLLKLSWFAGVSVVAGGNAKVAAEVAGASGAWVDAFVPPNLIASAATDSILPLMLFSLVFAIAMRKADADAGDLMFRFVRGVLQATFVIVGWLILLTPIVMFALAFRSSLDSGTVVGTMIVAFAAVEIIAAVAVLVLLYLLVAGVGGVPLVRYARALWPGMLTAITTRSSLATLPALMSSAASELRLRDEVTASVMPLAGATLKLSRAVSGPVKLLFLASVLHVDVTPERLLIFVVTIILLSATTVGVPTVTSGSRSLPAYIAAGIPAEYVVLLGVAVSLTDHFLTMLNASGYLASAAIVDRLVGKRSDAPESVDAEAWARPALAEVMSHETADAR